MVVCYARIARVFEAEPNPSDVLEPWENARIARFAKLGDRLRFATARRLARQLASELTSTMPRNITVRQRCIHCGSEEHGKPFVMHPGGVLPLSIAHAGDRVLVAITRGAEVGADIEPIDETRFDDQVLHHIESPCERGRTPCLAAAVTRLWVHKEAVLKCTGEGLMRSPRSFSIDFSCNPPEVMGLAGTFAVASLDVDHGYAAAVAVRGRELRVELA